MEYYTTLSREVYNHARFSELTPQAAAEWISGASCFRTLPEKLMKFTYGTMEEVKVRLKTGLCAIHTSPKEQESIRKNINNWFSHPKGIDDRVISRTYALEICFIFHLSLADADEFLRSVNGEGLHYRGVQEFVAAYALNLEYTYEEYTRLLEDILKESVQVKTEVNAEKYTRSFAEKIRTIHTDSELKAYVREHRGNFSNYHNTSYAYFMDMMEALQNGGTDASVEEIVAQNLYRRFVQKNKSLSDIEKSIRAGWPDKTYLSKMKNRELEVTRKVLILLYLASGGEVLREDPFGEDDMEAFMLMDEALDAETSGNADFEGLLTQIDAMLVECGFASMDPRLPFDWMVLFCMATGDLWELDDRFSEFLSTLFGNKNQK